MNRNVFLSIIVFAMVAETFCGGPDPGSYLLKVNLFINGKISIGYTNIEIGCMYRNYEVSNFYFPDSNKVNMHETFYKSLLYLNRFQDAKYPNPPEVVYTPKKYQTFSDSLYELKYNDTLLTYYLVKKQYELSKIDMVVMDSILWDDYYTNEIWVDSVIANIWTNQKIISHFQWVYNDGVDPGYSVDIISYDTAWSHSRITKHFNGDKLDSYFKSEHGNKWLSEKIRVQQLDPLIQKAINEKKIFCIWKSLL